MSGRRANGSKHPSLVEKIHGQPYLFTKYFSSKSFTSGIQFHRSESPYLNGGQWGSFAASWSKDSSVVIPNPPQVFVVNRVFESHLKSIRGFYKIDKDGFWKWLASVSLAGGLASVTYSFFTHPLYYAHTRLANDIKPSRESKRQFNGLVDVCKKTLRSDGIAGIYRGYNVSVLERILYTWAFIAITKTRNAGLFLGLLNDWAANRFLLEGTIFAASLVTYPMTTICRRMMMTSGQGVKYKGSVDAFSQILKKERLASRYKGVDAYILLCTVKFGLVVVSYSVVKGIISTKKKGSGGSDQSSSGIIGIK